MIKYKTITLLNRKRKLWSDDSKLWFLSKPRDMKETGIYGGLSLDNWNDNKYLQCIRAKE